MNWVLMSTFESLPSKKRSIRLAITGNIWFVPSNAVQSAEFLKMNPFGALPCLKDSSFDPPLVLYESRAIVRYLALQYGPGRLMPTPSDVRATALFEQAASIELTSFDPVANRLVFEEFFKPYVIACLQILPQSHRYQSKFLQEVLCRGWWFCWYNVGS